MKKKKRVIFFFLGGGGVIFLQNRKYVHFVFLRKGNMFTWMEF